MEDKEQEEAINKVIEMMMEFEMNNEEPQVGKLEHIAGGLEQGIELVDKTLARLQDFKKRLKQDKMDCVPASLKERLQDAWDKSSERFKVDVNIPVKIVIERGGHDWVNVQCTTYPFDGWDVNELPLSEASKSEVWNLHDRLDKRLKEWDDVRYEIKKKYHVDAADLLEDE